MYTVPGVTERHLLRLTEAENISRLNGLRGATIDALQEHNIRTIGDLMKKSPDEIQRIPAIRADESEKLIAFYHVLTKTIY